MAYIDSRLRRCGHSKDEHHSGVVMADQPPRITHPCQHPDQLGSVCACVDYEER